MMEVVWEWDDLSTDGSDGYSWSCPPFSIEYEFDIGTSMFNVFVHSNFGESREWLNIRALNVHPKDKEAVGESLLALCEQRYAQENPNG